MMAPGPSYVTRLVWDWKNGGVASFDNGECQLAKRVRGVVSLKPNDHIVEIDYRPHNEPPIFWIRYSGQQGRQMTANEIFATQIKLENMMRGAREGFRKYPEDA